MALSIHNNLLARHTARNLSESYSRLSSSVRVLSSGLRVNTAADDAAGLAIRELMRADIATLNQGARNVNDAISMIQTADGALAVIDEKLIRMKELAEQAATGTYDSTQRLLIDSEFQAMASEIDRIARATDFNGIRLLDGSLSGPHDGRGPVSSGAMKIHFGTGNDSAEDYYYVRIGDATLEGLGLRGQSSLTVSGGLGAAVDGWWNHPKTSINYDKKTITLDFPAMHAGEKFSPYGVAGLGGIDFYQIPVGLKDVTITSNGLPGSVPVHKSHVSLFTKNGVQLTGPPVPLRSGDRWEYVINQYGTTATETSRDWWNNLLGFEIRDAMVDAGLFDASTPATLDVSHVVNRAGESVTVNGITVDIIASQTESGSQCGNRLGPLMEEVIHVDEITDDLVFLIGGHVNPADHCNGYTLKIEATMTDEFLQSVQAPDQPESRTPVRTVRQGDILSIQTQQQAQEALPRLDEAMVRKDGIRAHLGALQNRLENTVTNLSLQAENLQASESQISDADMTSEMTGLMRSRILSRTGAAMLAQAHSLPEMLVRLIDR